MEKTKLFEKELNYIKDSRIRENISVLINLLPDYFFLVAASSTGKYHPSFTLGEGGLLRHTKVAVKIAYELLNNNTISNFTDKEKDLIICALILHDGLKYGNPKSEYTVVEHPLLSSKFIEDNKNKLNFTDEEIKYIRKCIETHMGEWNKDYKENVVLPLAETKEQRFVHMCDYLASRKFIDVKFDKNDIAC